MFDPLGFEGEVDHHNCILFHDADQQDDSDERYHGEIVAGKLQSQNRAYAGGRQRGENRDGMNVALIQYSQNDINRDNGGENQERLTRKRILKRRRCSLKCRVDAGRQLDILLGLFDGFRGLAK
jgi:hypothetical protein